MRTLNSYELQDPQFRSAFHSARKGLSTMVFHRLRSREGNVRLLFATSLLCAFFLTGSAQTEGPDYASYGNALETYVDDRGGVDYKGFKANPRDLEAYLSSIARLDPAVYESRSNEEKIAFWINAYNGLTLKAIIDHYPIQSSWTRSVLYPKNSIRQIDGVWDKLHFTVMGRGVTLAEIEHQELRAKFNEPRIHAALVCAAKSCPPLRNEPYLGSNLNHQLDDQMRAFLSNSTKFNADPGSGTVCLSEIFKWFGEDFVNRYGTDSKFLGYGPVERAVLNAIGGYVRPETRAYLERGGYKIEYLDYDWSLNER